MKVLNDTKLVLNELHMSDPLLIIKDQFGIIQHLQMSPIPQTSFLVGTFFAVSYSKTALERALELATIRYELLKLINAYDTYFHAGFHR